MRMDAPGMRKLVNGQLTQIVWMCSSTRVRMAAPGMKGQVFGQHIEGTWMCSGGRSIMAALTRLIREPGQLSNLLDWPEPPTTPSFVILFSKHL